MEISDREIRRIYDALRKIEVAEKKGARKNYYTNRCGDIRLVLKKVERREKGRLL
jgi:hypothetical protein